MTFKKNSIMKHQYYIMKTVLFILLAVLQATAQKKADPYKPDFSKPKKIAGMKLVWHDEFNKPGKPNSNNWSFESGFLRNKEIQWYQEDNATVKDGCLVIEGRRERVINPKVDTTSKESDRLTYTDYTSSSLRSIGKQEWIFGRFEIRARIDTSMGSFPAIWIHGSERPWPGSGEIDIMEFNRVKKFPTLNAAVITQLNDKGNPRYNMLMKPLSDFTVEDPDFVKKFHVWRLDWNKDSLKIYIDDKLLKAVPLSATIGPDGFSPFTRPQFLWLNLALGSWGGDPTNTKFPILFEVDYARVYQEK